MMKKALLLGMLLIPSLLIAQETQEIDERYLPGAVPVEEGKVVFTKELTETSLTQDQLFNTVLAWAESRFTDENNRVAYTDREKGEIAVVGKEKLIFSSTALSLDTSEMLYHLIITVTGNTARIQLTNISYRYDVSYERTPQRLIAEDIITDKYALTKKNKLNRINGKFRKGTVDFTDKLFGEIDLLFGRSANAGTVPTVTPVTPTPVVAPPTQQPVVIPAAPVAAKEGYMAFEAAKVPQALLMLLPDSPMQITAGEATTPVETDATWKGISEMFGKTVATVTINESSVVYQQIKDRYTLSFGKEGEATPWMLIECRKQGETTEGTTKTLLGEIVQIWIK